MKRKVRKTPIILNDPLINNDFEFIKYYKKSSIEKFDKEPKKYPEAWKRIYFKTYPRFKSIKLPLISYKNFLIKTLYRRKSERNFNKYKISLKEISYLLASAAIRKIYKNDVYYRSYRTYPSAGARYSLEVYSLILFSKNLQSGLYHYNVLDNSLEFMWNVQKKEIENSINQKVFLKSSFLFIITSVMKRGIIKYGERYFRFALIEAGHLAQNLILLATSINLKSCPIGGFKEESVMKILDLMPEELELPLYIIAVGK
jgi:SagB-type dehydrogenase family enzyme